MKRGFGLGVLVLLLAGITQAQQNVPPPAKAFAAAPEIPYDSVPNFLKLPTGLYLGEGIGVATNSKGHVFVYTRSGEASRLFEFDPKGTLVREIGKGDFRWRTPFASILRTTFGSSTKARTWSSSSALTAAWP